MHDIATTKSTITATRDESRNATVITIVLTDHDLSRRHLVAPDALGPVEALATYALHCLQVMFREPLQERMMQLAKEEAILPLLRRHAKEGARHG